MIITTMIIILITPHRSANLLLKRVINQFNRAYRRHDKVACNGLVRFVAQLVNQQLAHELLALQLCILLLETPTDDSVETVVTFVTVSTKKGRLKIGLYRCQHIQQLAMAVWRAGT